MDRPTAEGRVASEGFERGGFLFRPAGPSDSGALTRLINDNAIPGWIDLAYQIAEGALSPPWRAVTHRSVIGVRLRDGQPGGLASRSVYPCFIDGQPGKVGWLGQWRITREFRGRPHLLRAGFEATRRFLNDPEETPTQLAAVISSNRVARRLVEANVAGFPRFDPLFTCATLALRPRRAVIASNIRAATEADASALVDFINTENRERQFATRIPSAGAFQCGDWSGLSPRDFLLSERDGRIDGVVALWNQSSTRRLVVRGYVPAVRWLRPFVNVVARLCRLPTLPAVGSSLRCLYLALLTVHENNDDTARDLVNAALTVAASRNASIGLLGLATQDPLFASLKRRFRHISYESVIYRVGWSNTLDAYSNGLNGRCPKVEIALL